MYFLAAFTPNTFPFCINIATLSSVNSPTFAVSISSNNLLILSLSCLAAELSVTNDPFSPQRDAFA